MKHFEATEGNPTNIDCSIDPVSSLVEMFVDLVQQGRIAKGQCPALRPVFLKPHGVAYGIFRPLPGLPPELKVGLFTGVEYPAWVRFSSDTLPTLNDYKTTVGVGIKLFNAPTPKIFGQPDDTTFDFILQNFDVFFVDTAIDMCAFTKAGVVDGDYGPYLAAHPETAKLLDEMSKPVSSVLATTYWSGVPFTFGAHRYVKYKLEAVTAVSPIVGRRPTPPIWPMTYTRGSSLEKRGLNSTFSSASIRTSLHSTKLRSAGMRMSALRSMWPILFFRNRTFTLAAKLSTVKTCLGIFGASPRTISR